VGGALQPHINSERRGIGLLGCANDAPLNCQDFWMRVTIMHLVLTWY